MTRLSLLSASLLALATCGCSMAPPYAVPQMELPASFREEPAWAEASPSDTQGKGAWWERFDDPVLTALEAQVLVSNQNLASAAAAYQQARATVSENRSNLYPSVSLDASASRTEAFGSTSGLPVNIDQLNSGDRFKIAPSASWQPDVWGRIGDAVTQAGAQAEASLADLNNATLAAQGELASNYFRLRGVDATAALLNETVEAYTRTLEITRNRYREGVASRSDVAQAEVQLANARAQARDTERQRATYEHAIAVLAGQNPSSFSLEPTDWRTPMPEVPSILPSQLLERRPDIAAAERRVAAANAAIGVRKSAFFPTIGLTGSLSTSGSSVDQLFSAPNTFWSLGGSIAQSLFDFGGNKARLNQAKASYDQAVANYRQTVLSAFQDTEDGLAAMRVLKQVLAERASASESAGRAEAFALDRYLAGETDYTAVVTAQASALQAGQSEIQSVTDRQIALISLFQAIGGDVQTQDAHLPRTQKAQ